MPSTGHQPDPIIRDAARAACTIAALHYREALEHADRAQDALVHLIDRARAHGLTTADVCAATGLDEPYLTELTLQVEVDPS